MRKSASKRSFYDRGQEMVAGHTVNREALQTTRFAADETDGAAWDSAEGGEELDQRPVRGAFGRRRRHSNEERIVARAGDFGFPGAGNDADVELDAGLRRTDH